MVHLFKHNQEYFREFNDAPEKFILYEIHDVTYLKELLADKNLRININDRKKITNYISKTITPIASIRIKAVATEYIKKPLSGKYIPRNSFQHMVKSLKSKIYTHDRYVSLDIANRGFTVIFELARLNNIHLPCIYQLVHHRQKIYRDHANFWNDSKCGFLNLINYPVYVKNQTSFIKNLIDEINYVSKIFKNPDYPYFSLVNIIEIYSNKIMGLIAQYLIVKKIITDKFYSLNGDEICFQPLKPFKIEDIEYHIYYKTGFRIRLH